jgi:negative regulator of sigma E activity
MNLDDELRSALQRREPSPDFTARVLARVAAEPVRAVVRPWPSRPVTRWVAALAASVMLTAGALEYRHYQGERAKSQVLLAVRIAAHKLNKAQKKVQMLTHRSNS